MHADSYVPASKARCLPRAHNASASLARSASVRRPALPRQQGNAEVMRRLAQETRERRGGLRARAPGFNGAGSGQPGIAPGLHGFPEGPGHAHGIFR